MKTVEQNKGYNTFCNDKKKKHTIFKYQILFVDVCSYP